MGKFEFRIGPTSGGGHFKRLRWLSRLKREAVISNKQSFVAEAFFTSEPRLGLL